MSQLGSLTVEVAANVARFQSDMGRVAQIAEQNMRRVQQVSDAAANAAKTAFAGLAAGLSVGAFASSIKGAIDMADHLNDLSKQTGVAVSVLGGMGYAAGQAGADLDSTAKGLGKLNLKIAEAASGVKETEALFAAVGISIKTAGGETKKADQVFAELAGKFETYKEGPKTAALANAFLGKSYMALMPLLDDGAESLKKNIEVYNRYAGVTDEVAARADQFNDTMARIKLVSGALGRSLAAELLPTLQALADLFLRVKENGDQMNGTAQSMAEVFKAVSTFAVFTGVTFQQTGNQLGALAAQFGVLVEAAQKARASSGPLDLFGSGQLLDELKAAKPRIDAIDEAAKATLARARKDFSDFYDALYGNRAPSAGPAPSARPPRGREAPGIPGARGATSTGVGSPYAKFIEELDRMVKKTDEGEYAALRLKAAQLQAQEPALALAEAYRRIADVQANDSQRAVAAFVRGLDEEANALALQVNLLDKTVAQQERLTFAFQKRLAAEKAIEAAAKSGRPLTDEAIEQIKAQTEETITYTARLRDRRDALMASPAFGANNAVRAYIDDATNASRNAERLVGGSLDRIDDAITNFVKTGKLNFSELFNFMAEEFLRQSIRMSVAKFIDPKQGGFDIGSLFSSGIGSLFGSIGGFFGTPLASGLDYVPYDGFPAILHQGERVQTAVQARGESRGAGPLIQFGATNIGNNVSRAEVASAIRKGQAETEMRVRRLIAQGTLN